MKKLAAVCATVVLATSLGLAQSTASQPASDDNRRGNFGWIACSVSLLAGSDLLRVAP
jgi:hypothetical protein